MGDYMIFFLVVVFILLSILFMVDVMMVFNIRFFDGGIDVLGAHDNIMFAHEKYL